MFSVQRPTAAACALTLGLFFHSAYADGTLDATYTPPAIDVAVFDALPEEDGSTIYVGQFPASASVPNAGIVKLTSTGTVDTTFANGLAGAEGLPITSILRQPDGKYIVGGSFTKMHGVSRKCVARLNSDGTLDTSFDPGTGPNITANQRIVASMVLLPDGKLLVGGFFTTWNSTAHAGLVRLNADGSLDTSFGNLGSIVTFPGGDMVTGLALQASDTSPNYRIIVGGFFYGVWTGANHSGVIRLNATDGSRDPTFAIGIGAHSFGNNNSVMPVACVTVQADRKIIAGGNFTGFSTKSAKGIARLNEDGSFDTSFVCSGVAGGSADVFKVLSQPDNKILAAGFYTSAGGSSAPGLARFNADGSRDTGFDPDASGAVGLAGIRLQKDVQVLACMYGSTNTSQMVRRLSNSLTAPGFIRMASATASVTEDNDVTLTVERVDGSAGKLAVAYATVNGTATLPFDYTAATGLLTWDDGDSASKTITVHVPLDGTLENDETFGVNLVAIGSTFLGAQRSTTITVHDGDTAGSQPVIIFRSASQTVSENATSVTVQVDMSSAATGIVSVPFTVGGSANNPKDFTISPASPLTLAVGETTKTITITLVNDVIPEPDKTIVLTIPNVTGALLDSTRSVHTITLTDDEAKPVFTLQPKHTLTYVGQPAAVFAAAASGIPTPTLQWYQNGKIITGLTGNAIQTLNLTLSSASTLSLKATNKIGTVTYTTASANAEIEVVDKTEKTFVLGAGATSNAVMTVPTAGKLITYEWRDATGTPLQASSRLLNVKTKTLTIKGLTTGDSGNYICRVGNPDPLQFIDVTYHLKVVTEKPVITVASINLGSVLVSEPITPFQIPVSPTNIATNDRAAASFRADVLPSGIKLDPVTGILSGRPTVAKLTGPYSFKVFAKNAKGETLGVPVTLVVNAFPANIAGTYMGSIERIPVHNPFGGRVDFTVKSNGTLTGKVILGGGAASFTGAINTSTASSTSCTASIPITGTTLTLSFDYSATTGLLSNAVLTDGSHPMVVTGWRNVWNPAPAVKPYAGYYTVAFNPPPAQTNPVPEGNGYASFTVAPTGTLTVSGALADSIGFSTAGFVSPEGKVLIFKMLYTLRGSVHGMLEIAKGVAPDFSDNSITGTANWRRNEIKPVTTTNRIYVDGFTDAPITAVGGHYVPVGSSSIVLGMDDKDGNAKLSFADGGLGTNTNDPNPDYTFRIKKGGAPAYPSSNPSAITIAVTPGTGFFKGTFAITQTNNNLTPPKSEKRTATFAGMIVNHSGGASGCGYFLLPTLSTPTVGATLTPKLSGQVLLEKVPTVP